MRVLLVNKFLRPVGGAETVFFQVWRWLEAAGHDVIPFGMAHPDNVASEYQRFWVDQVDYDRPTLTQLRDVIWNRDAARKLEELVAATRPEVAHLHNIYHQLSPSILPVLKNAGIPAVLTAHDYKLICPNYRLFTQNAPCTRCVQSHPWHAIRHRCQKDSLAASALVALETALHRRWDAYGSLARVIAPSRFVRDMLVRGGTPQEKITVIPHAVGERLETGDCRLERTTPSPISNLQSPILFAGRLEPEKGVRVLLAAAARLPDLPFALAGSGSLYEAIAAEGLANVTLLGKLTSAELAAVRGQARAEVIPSRWAEVFGMSALEAMQAGLPVIASDVGALPELVWHEETGLLVPPDDVSALADAIRRIWHDDELVQRLAPAGQAYVRTHHRPEQHLQTLLDLYHTISEQTVS